MLTVDPTQIPVARMHSYLLGAVTPRPIALASTIDKSGQANLSPFSFFNCFGANPPLLIFSPSRRVRDNTTKHTLENVREHSETVVGIVNYDMVQQASLASTEYPRGVNEFVKAGLTPVPSVKVKPPRIGESPVNMECKVLQVISSGDQGGAGNLVICQILLMHISEDVLDDQGKIDPWKLDVVARLGGDYYARVQGDAIFKVPKPLDKLGIGIDGLPDAIRKSTVLTGNDLALLANVERLPLAETSGVDLRGRSTVDIHREAKELIASGRIPDAWQLLLRSIK